MCNKSESIKNLAIALVKFNAEMKIIEKDATNPHFKNQYASLDTIIDEVRPLLAKHGLSMMQFPGGDGEKFTLRSMLLHESGEWIESEPITMRPVKNDPQGIGSCSTYARRYSLSAMLSLNTGEDDDGNAATQPQKPTQAQPSQPSQQSRQPTQAPTSQPSSSGGSIMARVYKLREELGWGWPDLNQFAGDTLDREIKFLKKDITDTKDWEKVEQAMIATRDGTQNYEPIPEESFPF